MYHPSQARGVTRYFGRTERGAPQSSPEAIRSVASVPELAGGAEAVGKLGVSCLLAGVSGTQPNYHYRLHIETVLKITDYVCIETAKHPLRIEHWDCAKHILQTKN